jgi:hypothetical protein
MNPENTVSDSVKHVNSLNSLKSFSKISCWLVVTYNTVALITWFIQNSLSTTILLVNPLVSLCFIFIAISTLLKFEEANPAENRIIGHTFSIVVILISSIAIASFLPLSVSQSIIGADFFQSTISLASAFCLLFLSISTFSFSNSLFPVARFYHFFALFSLAFSLYGLLIIIFTLHLDQLPIDLSTIINGISMVLCLLLSRPNHGVMRILTTPLPVSTLARRLLIAAIITPIFLGIIREIGVQIGLFSIGTSFTLLIIAHIISFTFLIWIVSNYFYNNDISLIKLSEILRAKTEEVEYTAKQLEAKIKELEESKKKIQDLLHYQEKLRDLDN